MKPIQQLRVESASKSFYTIICLILKVSKYLKQTHLRHQNSHQHNMKSGLQVYLWFLPTTPLEFNVQPKLNYLDINSNQFQVHHVRVPVMSLVKDMETVNWSLKIDQSATLSSLLAVQICERVVRRQENVFQRKHVRMVTTRFHH